MKLIYRTLIANETITISYTKTTEKLVKSDELHVFLSAETLEPEVVSNGHVVLIGLTNPSLQQEQQTTLKNLPLDLGSDVFLYFKHNDSYFDLWEAYKIIKRPTKATIIKYGFWTREFGLTVSQKPKWQRRKDFRVINCI